MAPSQGGRQGRRLQDAATERLPSVADRHPAETASVGTCVIVDLLNRPTSTELKHWFEASGFTVTPFFNAEQVADACGDLDASSALALRAMGSEFASITLSKLREANSTTLINSNRKAAGLEQLPMWLADDQVLKLMAHTGGARNDPHKDWLHGPLALDAFKRVAVDLTREGATEETHIAIVNKLTYSSRAGGTHWFTVAWAVAR